MAGGTLWNLLSVGQWEVADLRVWWKISEGKGWKKRGRELAASTVRIVARVRGCESCPRAVVSEVAPAGLQAMVVPIRAFLHDVKTLVWDTQCGIHNGRTIIVGRVGGRSGHTSLSVWPLATVSRNFESLIAPLQKKRLGCHWPPVSPPCVWAGLPLVTR